MVLKWFPISRRDEQLPDKLVITSDPISLRTEQDKYICVCVGGGMSFLLPSQSGYVFTGFTTLGGRSFSTGLLLKSIEVTANSCAAAAP